MEIKQIEIYKSRIRLRKPFVISLGLFEFAENILIRIKTDNGISGFGECSPIMTINGESMDTCFVVAHYLAKVLLKKNPLSIEECSQTMDAVIYGNASIKSAFDIALHDIAAQHNGLPLYAYLGGKNNKTLITDYTVSIGEPNQMAADAEKIKQEGYSVIKIKLGESKEKDIERIKIIREKIGTEIPLRIRK